MAEALDAHKLALSRGWQSVEAAGTSISPRSGHSAVADEDGTHMYVYGGYNATPSTEMAYHELWRYTFRTHAWGQLPNRGDVPRIACSQSMLIFEGALYVFGGTAVPFGFVNSNTMYRYDLEAQSWDTVVCTGTPPSERFGQSMSLGPEDSFYIIGGTDGDDFLNDVFRFHVRTSVWERVRSEGARPRPRYRHEVVRENDNALLLVGGGWPWPSLSLIEKIYRFVYNPPHWEAVETHAGPDGFPMCRRAHSCTRHRGAMHMLGGQVFREGDLNATERALPEHWKLDLGTMAWELVCSADKRSPLHGRWPLPTYFHTCVLRPEAEDLVVFGGVHNARRVARTQAVRIGMFSLVEWCIFKLKSLKITRDDLDGTGVPTWLAEAILTAQASPTKKK